MNKGNHDSWNYIWGMNEFSLKSLFGYDWQGPFSTSLFLALEICL
jgi:hypothetical protein